MPTKPGNPGKFLRKSGDCDTACRLLSDVPYKKNSARDKLQVYKAERWLGYPLIDHETYWRVVGGPKNATSEMVVSHAYWNERSIEQLEGLRERIKCNGTSVVIRDAIWCDQREIKQVFIMGSNVPQEAVLGLPYDHFDDRCSPPSTR